jgi:ribonuclease M5
MNNFKEVIVVEGYHDLAKLKEIYDDVDVVITNGSEVTQETLVELKKLNNIRGLILLLDPDYQGERIRRIINEYVGETKHAFIEKKKCISRNRKKVGIEHAAHEDIILALSELKTSKIKQNNVSQNELMRLGLIGMVNSKKLREKLSISTGIGLSNGKTLCKKLNMFGYTLEQIEAIIRT